MPTEIELKLALDPRAASRVARLPSLRTRATGAATTRTLRSTYFDTPDEALRRAGIALRLRRDGRVWLQTVKSAGTATAGLHTREEGEHRVRGGAIDLAKIDDADLQRRLAKWQAAGELAPRFATVFRRTAWLLQTADGAAIECALDRGEIRTPDGARSASICEVELELKAGQPAALFAFARELAQHVPLAPDERSKAERGYALLHGDSVTDAVKAEAVVLNGSNSAGAAFASIIGSGVAHLARNREAAMASPQYDPEHVHQMRVALRRLRTAFTLFAHLDPGLQSHAVLAELRFFASLLGDARNWDVFTGDILPSLKAASTEPALQTLLDRAARECIRSRRLVREALRSPRYTPLVLALGELALEARSRPALSAPLSSWATSELSARYRRLRKTARGLAAQSGEERHRVRIAAKRVRYAAEFFSSLYPERKVDKFLRRFTALQDVLGALNDLAMARALASSLTGRGRAPDARAQGLVLGWCMAREQALLESLLDGWKKVKRADVFWPEPVAARAMNP
jgi:inorganic triphosphatase YgiF